MKSQVTFMTMAKNELLTIHGTDNGLILSTPNTSAIQLTSSDVLKLYRILNASLSMHGMLSE